MVLQLQNSSYNIIDGRIQVETNIKELKNRANKFGRVECFKDDKTLQQNRPFPNFFAWQKDVKYLETSDALSETRPPEILSSVSNQSKQNSSVQIISSECEIPIHPEPSINESINVGEQTVDDEKKISKPIAIKVQEKAAVAKPINSENKKGSRLAAPIIKKIPKSISSLLKTKKMLAEKKNSSNIKSEINLQIKLEDSCNTETKVAHASQPPEQQLIEQISVIQTKPEIVETSQNDTDKNIKTKISLNAERTKLKAKASSPSKMQLISDTLEGKEKNVIETKSLVKVKKDILPKYAQSLQKSTKPEKTQEKVDTAPILSITSVAIEEGGGGFGGFTCFDDLALLCKQHKKQYQKCKDNLSVLSNHPAGIVIAGDARIPSFFAWKDEVSSKKNSNLLPSKLETKVELDNDAAEKLNHNIQAKEKDGKIINTNTESRAGTATYWDPKSPHFYAWATNEKISPITETKASETKGAKEYEMREGSNAGMKTYWDPKSPYFYAWSSKPLEENNKKNDGNIKQTPVVQQLADSKASDCAGAKTYWDPASPYLYAWPSETKKSMPTTAFIYHKPYPAVVEAIKSKNYIASDKTTWDPKAPFFFAWPSLQSHVKEIRDVEIALVNSKKEKTAISKTIVDKEVIQGTKTSWDIPSPFYFAWSLDQHAISAPATQERLREESRRNLEKLQKNLLGDSKETMSEVFPHEIPITLSPKDEQTKIIVIEKDLEESIAEKRVGFEPSQKSKQKQPSQKISSEVKVSPVEEREWTIIDELRRERAIGKKHRKMESEILQQCVRRSEYMAQYRWPAYDTREGNINSVSVYGTRNYKPAGMPIYTPRKFVGDGARALEVAQEVGREYLHKKIVPGGIEDLEGDYDRKTGLYTGEKITLKKKSMAVSIPQQQKVAKTASIKNVLIEEYGNHCFEKSQALNINDMERIWGKKRFQKRNVSTSRPNNFAWKQKKQLIKDKRKGIKRWRPKLEKLENTVFMYKRYPISERFRPVSEYKSSFKGKPKKGRI